jgi:hypothetical protein
MSGNPDPYAPILDLNKAADQATTTCAGDAREAVKA